MSESSSGKRRGGRVLLVDGLDEGSSVRSLKRVDFRDASKRHDEHWLQSLIHHHPQVLPVTDIEPSFDTLIPVCRELSLPSGYLDNLFVTARGDLILVECKLWRNPQARREVVAQIIDYAHCFARWNYAEFDEAVRKARSRPGGDGLGLYEIATLEDEVLDEDAFVDAVSKNLRLGRFLLIIAGDGIHESVETLAEYLDQHAGFHFTLALVELRIYEAPDQAFLVIPQILSRTLNIERGVVRIEEGRPIVQPTNRMPDSASGSKPRASSISEEKLFDSLAGIDADLPRRLKDFAARMEDINVRLEAASRSIVIRWRDDIGGILNIGAVNERGEYLSDYANWGAHGIGRLDLSHAYLAAVAGLIGGNVRETPTPQGWYVVLEGRKTPPVLMLLAKANQWEAEIRSFVEQYRDALSDQD